MQLKCKGKISHALAAATCSLLAGTGQAATKDGNWDFTHLHYSEVDRVTVDETLLIYEKGKDEEKGFTFKFYHDTISGATPSGAAPSDTYTSPSGQVYNAGAEQHLLPITDERYAVAAEWSRQHNRLQSSSFGFSLSDELDYSSLGLHYSSERDSKNRLETYKKGFSLSLDYINPEGGVPTPLAPTTDTTRYDSEQKAVVDFLAGYSQVMNRRAVMDFNYTFSYAQGYLTDPYKVISVSNSPLQFEYRPESRASHAFFIRSIYNQKGGILKGSYRLYIDNWGVLSHTVDGSYRMRSAWKGWVVKPRLRFYLQSAASFYSYSYFQATPVTGYASSDYRLGNLATVTMGLYMNRKLKSKRMLSMRLELMQQADRAGVFEPVNVFIAQLSYQYSD